MLTEKEVLHCLNEGKHVLDDHCENLVLGHACATFQHPCKGRTPPQDCEAAIIACKRRKTTKNGRVSQSVLCEACHKGKDRSRKRSRPTEDEAVHRTHQQVRLD